MKIAKLLILFPLALLPAGFAAGHASSMSPAPAPCQVGFTKGMINLPVVTPLGVKGGTLKGVLLQNKLPGFELTGKLTLIPSPGHPGSRGEVEGVLRKLHGPGQAPTFFAKVKGKWIATPTGIGEYRLVVIKPGLTPVAPSKMIGKIKAKFADMNLMTPGGMSLPGKFQGGWKICK